MEIFRLEKEIKIICVNAKSFPDGVSEAFDLLNKKIGSNAGRIYYGISWMDKTGAIIYKAAVNEAENGEAEKLGCEPFTIRKGIYLTETVRDFMKNIPAVGETFKKLLADPRLDTNGYCVEIYFGQDDVQCLVTLDPGKA